jgi:predicted component of type VI protein secretion system
MIDNPHEPKLIFVTEPFAGRVEALLGDKITVGRAGNNTVTIAHPSISRAHCEILVHGPEVIVRDLGSANGTFIQNVRLNPQAQLKHGQLVRIGGVTARLELTPCHTEQTGGDQSAVFEYVATLRAQESTRQITRPSSDATTRHFEMAPGEATLTLKRTSRAPTSDPNPHKPTNEVTPGRLSRRVWLIASVIATLGLITLLCRWLRT